MSKSKRNRRVVYVSIDVEASGPVPGIYSMLSIGACMVRDDEPGSGPIEIGSELYLELKPEFERVSEEAVAVCGLDLDRLEREGLTARDAMDRLTAWVREHVGEDERAVFVGHNAPFDWMMVRFYYEHTGAENPFGYNALDTKALAMGLYGMPWPEAGKGFICRKLGLEEDMGQKHRADYDARYQAQILEGLLLEHRKVAARQ
ncbi:MAG: 3'-5' exonuclease [Planctomycetota bacterium]|jgi:DNA polymerase III alpha subunit (gram-positive type)